MNFLGEMKIIKNRWGIDGQTDSRMVREEILLSMDIAGFSNYEGFLVLGAFNSAVAEILDEPVIQDERYPLGINYRDYMMRGIFIKNKIKRHKLV
jgi:hypothetical protein